MRGLEEAAQRAVTLYNRYRAPEAVAELVAVEDGRIVVRFRGPFCHTCGVVDWIEDYRYVLEDLGVKAELLEARQIGEEEWIGVFVVR